jgi:RimJ/RimL family protein N-acetyltransferase
MHLTYKDLTIRAATPADAEQLCAWWNDGEVMAHAGFPHGLGVEPGDVRARLADGGGEMRLQMREQGGKPIGEMHYRDRGGAAAIGIKICSRACQGKGTGTALLKIFITALFDTLGFEKVTVDANAKNLRAQHVYENKLGFKKVRVNENSWRDQLGQMQSSIDYEMTVAEWRANLPV